MGIAFQSPQRFLHTVFLFKDNRGRRIDQTALTRDGKLGWKVVIDFCDDFHMECYRSLLNR